MSSPKEKPFYRRIRSFVKREGRLTKGQQRALDELLPRFGIAGGQGIFDLAKEFGRDAPKILEIGFGTGTSLTEMAKSHLENDYLGIEVHRPGVGNLLLQIEKDNINNIRVMCDDAVEVLQNNIADDSLDAVYLFFADPWHKKKHHKRRIVQHAFVQLLRKKLKTNGIFHMATDWQDYAEHMMKIMSEAEGFENTAGDRNYIERPGYRPLTKFEQRGQRLGHGVWDLMFKKVY
jgi:tRNA (guanine-N7-)-methyltransferase